MKEVDTMIFATIICLSVAVTYRFREALAMAVTLGAVYLLLRGFQDEEV